MVATPEGGVRMPFVRMTLRQMAQFGLGDPWREEPDGAIERAPRGVPLARCRTPWSPTRRAASYFAALPLVAGGSLRLDGLRPAAREPPGRRPVPRRPGPVRGGRRGRRRRDHGLVRARAAARARRRPGLLRDSRTRSSRSRRSRRSSTGRRGSSGSATREGRRRTASPGWRQSSGASARASSRRRTRSRSARPRCAPGSTVADPRGPPVRDELRGPWLPRPARRRRGPGFPSPTPPAARRPSRGFLTCSTRSAENPRGPDHPMPGNPFIIVAIDGGAASGKSSTSRDAERALQPAPLGHRLLLPRRDGGDAAPRRVPGRHRVGQGRARADLRLGTRIVGRSAEIEISGQAARRRDPQPAR